MRFFQILDCSGDIGTCCSDYSIANLLWVVQVFFKMITVLVPIILIVMATYKLIKMMNNPDEASKQGGSKKELINKFIAAIIVFFLPWLVNLVLNFTNYTDITSFEVGRCWVDAEAIHTELENTEHVDRDTFDGKKNPLFPEEEYEPGIGSGSGDASDVIEYAKSFIGVAYIWGGTNLSVGVDCSGFVQQVFVNFGVNLPRNSEQQGNAGTQVNSIAEAQPGDILHFSNHVAIYMGNDEFIHSSGGRGCTNSNPCTAKDGRGVRIQKLSSYYRQPDKIRRVL